MKLVINRCYGGFGVSVECLYELVKAGSPVAEGCDIPHYYGADIPHFADQWEAKWRDAQKDLTAFPLGGDRWKQHPFFTLLYDLNTNKVYSVNRNYDVRADKTLVRLVEERGSDWASGPHAELSVVEIPDGVEWEISGYDGIERVEDQHRSWA